MSRVFCCNYLYELDELIREGKVDVDYVKFPSINTNSQAFERALELKPVIFHGFAPADGNLASPDFIDNINLEDFKSVLKKTNAFYISGHITAIQKDYPDYEIDNQEHKRVIFQNAAKNIQYLKKNFDMTIAIENTVFEPKECEIIKCVTDTDFISSLVYDCNVNFLFDTSHARQSAYNRNMDFKKYLEGLPLDRLFEVHLSGTIMDEVKGLTAPHTKMNQEDYEMLEYLLKNTPVKVITLEYGPLGVAKYDYINPKIKQEFYEQIVRIKEIMEKYEK